MSNQIVQCNEYYLSYDDGDVRGDHPADPGTKGAHSHGWVPDHSGEELCREEVDRGEGGGGADLPYHRQPHHAPLGTCNVIMTSSSTFTFSGNIVFQETLCKRDAIL